MSGFESAGAHFQTLSNRDKVRLADIFADKFKAALPKPGESVRHLDLEAIADAAYAAARAEFEATP